jgi:hypothetical protein
MSDFDYAEQMAQQEQELAQYKLEEWRSAALEKHPGATPLKHLLLGTSPEAVEQLAKDVAESLAGQAQQEPTRQGPYVPAGTPAIYNETPDDRMQDIIQGNCSEGAGAGILGSPSWRCEGQSTLTTKRTMVLRSELATSQQPGSGKSIPVGQNCSELVYP